MTMLPHKNFTGEFPRLNAYDLQPGAAQSATNVDFTQGNLQGIKTRVAVPGVSAPGAKSIYIYDSLYYSYYTWARDVDAVRSPIAEDAYSRFYWCDGSNFWVSRGDLGGSGGEPSSTNRYWVGVPEPTAVMTTDAAANTFNINGYSPSSITVFAEGSDGSRKNESSPSKTVSLNNLSNYNATLGSAAVPITLLNNPADGSAVTVTYKLAVEVVFTNGTNSYKAILRTGSGTSTIPGELLGLSTSLGTTVSNAGTASESYVVTVQLQAGSAYTEARAYTYTYVNFWGEEGPPAKPLTMDVGEGQKVTVKFTPPPTTSNYAPINRVRIYRTGTGGSGTEYLFVAEVQASTGTFVDDVAGSALGESIQTRDFYPPPQTMRGIVMMPGGILAGFSGNTVYFSQPYLPYAWKPSTTQALENRVIGVCPYENGLYVTTTAHPVLITGYHPDTMSSQKIPAIQAGVSKGSLCNAGPFAVYASNDGLVTLRGINASLDMSFKFFTRAQWRNLYASKLSQMRLNVHDGHLLAWFDDGTPGFLIRLDEVTPSFTKVTDPVYCALVHPQTDSLYVGAGGTLYNFKAGGSGQAWTHWGKDYILPKQENLGAIQFVGGGDVTVTVYADGTEVFKQLVTMNQSGSTVIRLPSGFRARRWSFKLEGAIDSYVYEMNVCTSPSELQGV